MNRFLKNYPQNVRFPKWGVSEPETAATGLGTVGCLQACVLE